MKPFLRFYLRSFFLCVTLFAVALCAGRAAVQSAYAPYRHSGGYALPPDSGPGDALLVAIFTGEKVRPIQHGEPRGQVVTMTPAERDDAYRDWASLHATTHEPD